jgi:hypothetical protein
MEPDQGPDKYQQAWRAQSTQTRITIDADSLLEAVQRSQRNFRAIIFWRDFREVVIALLLIPVWFYLGDKNSPYWTWYLTVPVLIWIAGFMLVYRLRHPQEPSEPNESLRECVKNLLTHVEDQIWLLRNVFWWYLLPPGLSISAFFLHVAWRGAVMTNDWAAGVVAAALMIAFVVTIYGFIYYLNQRAVDSHLEPQRQELGALLASLEDETASDVGGEYPILMGAERAACSNRRMLIGLVCLLIAMAVIFLGLEFIKSSLGGYPKKSPFEAVRWHESQPEVKVDGQWYKLVSMDDLAASEIVAFSRRTYGNLWQKRFEEDLVELLTLMGHPPQDRVTLVVQSLTSPETRTLKDVPMTRANRQAIWDAAQARERAEQP